MNFEVFLACHPHVPFFSSIISRKISLMSPLVSKDSKDIGDSLNLFCSLSAIHLRHLLTYYMLKWDMISILLGVMISLWIFWVPLGALLLQRTEINALGSLFQACIFKFHFTFIKCKIYNKSNEWNETLPGCWNCTTAIHEPISSRASPEAT